MIVLVTGHFIHEHRLSGVISRYPRMALGENFVGRVGGALQQIFDRAFRARHVWYECLSESVHRLVRVAGGGNDPLCGNHRP